MNTTKKEVKVGLIGVGLNTYWNQFEGLLSRLTDYQRMIKERMSSLQATVIDGGMVDSPEKAARTAEVLRHRNPLHLYFDLCPFLNDPSDRPAHQDSGYPAQHTTRSRHKLRLYQRIRRPWKNDRRMAGSLPSLFHSGICLRIQPCRHQIRHPDRLPRRTIRMERNRKLDRCGKGRTRDA